MSPERPSIPCLAAVTFLAAAPALALQGAKDPAVPASVQRASVGVRAFADRLVAGGPDYRLEARRSGVRFVPALGSRAERALSVEFALESVSVGGVALPIAPAGPAGADPAADGTSLVHYARGAGVSERYELLPKGVEQSFVLAALPPERGEVIVRGRLASDLPIVSSDERSGLVLAREGLGGVRIGGVTGIDAAGRTAPGRVLLSGDMLELRLSAAFVAGATLPLTLDPLIAALIPINSGTPDDGEVDVAFLDRSSGPDQYLVVWTRMFAGGDTEIRGQLLDPDATLSGGLLLISTSDANTKPAVGSFDLDDAFLVAWEHRKAAAPDSDVLAASVDLSGAISPETPVGSTAANEVEVDVCKGTSSCSVAWCEVSAGIRVATVVLDAFGDPTVYALYNATTGAFDRNPALASTTLTPYTLLVWNSPFAIRGKRFIGNPATGTVLTIQSATASFGPPACAAADHDDFMVVWSQTKTGAPVTGSHDVYGARILFPGMETLVEPAFAIEEDAAEDERYPAIAYAAHEYLVAYQDQNQATDDLVARAIDAMTGQVLEEMVLDTLGTFSPPALAGDAGWHSDGDDVLVAYAVLGDVLAAVADGVGGTHSQLYSSGCIGAGAPLASAAYSPNAQHRQELWSAEPGAPCFLGVGWAEQPIDLGGATLVPALDQCLVLYAGLADAAGYVGLDVSIPAGLAGDTYWFQWAIVPSGASCTSLGIDLADALEIAIE